MKDIYTEMLNLVIEDGIKSIRLTYPIVNDKSCGAIAGFEVCRDKHPNELAELLKTAEDNTRLEHSFEIELNQCGVTREHGYWYYRYYHLQVEWVINS